MFSRKKKHLEKRRSRRRRRITLAMNKEQRKLNLDPNAMNMESLEVETYNNIQ